MATVDVQFPGNIPSVATLAGLKAIPSFDLDNGDVWIVRGTGFFIWHPESLDADDYSTVIRPNDLTPLQRGRWKLNNLTGGAGLIPPSYVTFITTEGQTRFPETGDFTGYDDGNFAYDPSILEVYVSGLDVTDSGAFSAPGGTQAITFDDPFPVGILVKFKGYANIGTGGGGVPFNSSIHYDVAQLPRLDTDLDPNGDPSDQQRFDRAQDIVLDPTNADYGKILYFRGGMGSVAATDPATNDPRTGQPIPAKFLRKKGDWNIYDFHSYVPQGIAKVDGSWRCPIQGQKGLTRFVKPINVGYHLFAYKGGTGTVQNPNEQYYTIPGLSVDGVTFVEDVARQGFFESFCCISVHAVDGLTVSNCTFLGPRGDAIYIGASDKGTGEENRHNRNVVIRNNWCDGYNQNNRQFVSIQDCDGLEAYGNTIVNMTKPGNPPGGPAPAFDEMNPQSSIPMPAAYDIEPNIEVLNPITKNIRIHDNYIGDGGGYGIVFFFRNNNDIPVAGRNCWFHHNTVERCRAAFQTGGSPDQVEPNNIFIHDNVFRENWFTFLFREGRGVDVYRNLFEDSTEQYSLSGAIGFGVSAPFQGPKGVRIVDNEFHNNGVLGAGAFSLINFTDLLLAGNKFIDNSNVAMLARFPGAVSKFVMTGNQFVYSAKQKDFAISAQPGSGGPPTFDLATCREHSNDYIGLANFNFVLPGGRSDKTPSTGAWTIGQIVYGPENAAGGEPRFRSVTRSAVGTGDGTSGNDMARWAIQPMPGGLPDKAPDGSFNTAAFTLSSGMRNNVGRFTNVTGGTQRVLGNTFTFPANDPHTFVMQSPSKGSYPVFAGFFPQGQGTVDNLGSNQLVFGVYFENGDLRSFKNGVLGAVAASGVIANQTVRFTTGGGVGRIYLTNQDGVESQVGGDIGFTVGVGTNYVIGIIMQGQDTLKLLNVV